MNTIDIVSMHVEVLEIAEQVRNAPAGVSLDLLDARLEAMKRKLLADIDERLEEIAREEMG